LFNRILYKKFDKFYYNYASILAVYLILKKIRGADDFTKTIIKELLFI